MGVSIGATSLLVIGVVAAVALSGSPPERFAKSRTSPHTTIGDPRAAPSSAEPASPAPTTVPTTEPPPSNANSLAAVRGKTILVDPGHNGANSQDPEINEPVDIGTQTRACDTSGTSTNDGYTESAYNFAVALRLRDILERSGAHVVLTRQDDDGVGPCINVRAAIGNDARADVGISIHADGGPSEGRGFHVIHAPALPDRPDIPGLTEPIPSEAMRLALDIRAAYELGTDIPRADYIGSDGLSARTDLGGLNLSTIPKVFIESGNMRNAVDAELLKDPAFQDRIAAALAEGLARYLAGQ